MEAIDIRIGNKYLHEATSVLLKLQEPFHTVVFDYSSKIQTSPLDLTKYLIDYECYEIAFKIIKGRYTYEAISPELLNDVSTLTGAPKKQEVETVISSETILKNMNKLTKNLSKHWYNSKKIKVFKDNKMKEFKHALIELSGVAPNDVLDFVENIMSSIKNKSVNYLEQALSAEKLKELNKVIQSFF